MRRTLFRSERLQKIEQLLYHAPDGLRATEIAEKLNVGRRTVYRDLELMGQEGIPLSSQSLDELAEGGLLFTVRVCDPREMRPWIRSWGADVEVLEPPELRAEMAEQARRLMAHYHAAGSTDQSARASGLGR